MVFLNDKKQCQFEVVFDSHGIQHTTFERFCLYENLTFMSKNKTVTKNCNSIVYN